YWPSQEAIGKRLRLAGENSPWMEVVGVARTVKYQFIAERPMPFVYLPFEQSQKTRMVLLVETSGDADSVAGPLRDAVRSIDPNQPIYNARTFSSFYQNRALAVPRLLLQMVGTMGVVGLTLALIGLYGLIAYSVSRRTKEIGVRIAIGAAKS